MAGLRRAVVVGIDEYEDRPKITSLKGAVRDAEEVCKGLTEFGEFTVEKEHFLCSDKAKAEAVRQAISDLFLRHEACELALFYFSGHGIEDGHGNVYLAPYDIKHDQPFVRGIRIQELKDVFLEAKNKEKAL